MNFSRLSKRGKFFKYVVFVIAPVICLVAGFTFLSVDKKVSADEVSDKNKKQVLKIAVLDVNKMLEGSLAQQDILHQMDAETEKFKARMQKSENSLKKKRDELESQRNVLSKDVFDKKNDAISKEAADLNVSAYKKRETIEKAYAEAMKALEKIIYEVLEKVATENGYDLVVDRRLAMYSKKDLDVTADVVKKMNSALTSVKVKFESDPKATIDSKTSEATDIKKQPEVRQPNKEAKK